MTWGRVTAKLATLNCSTLEERRVAAHTCLIPITCVLMTVLLNWEVENADSQQLPQKQPRCPMGIADGKLGSLLLAATRHAPVRVTHVVVAAVPAFLLTPGGQQEVALVRAVDRHLITPHPRLAHAGSRLHGR